MKQNKPILFTLILLLSTLLKITPAMADQFDIITAGEGVYFDLSEADAERISTFLYTSPQDFNQKNCGGNATDAELMSLFGSLSTFNCQDFRRKGELKKYCNCIELIMRPDPESGYSDTIFQDAIEKAYLDLMIQRSNRSRLLRAQASVPLEMFYNTQLEDPNAKASCYSQEAAEALKDDNYHDDFYLKAFQQSEGTYALTSQAAPSNRQTTLQQDSNALQALFKKMIPEIQEAYNSELKFMLNRTHANQDAAQREIASFKNGQISRAEKRVKISLQYNHEFLTRTMQDALAEQIRATPELAGTTFSDLFQLVNEPDEYCDETIQGAMQPITVALMEIGRQNGAFDSRENMEKLNPDNLSFDVTKLPEAFKTARITGEENCTAVVNLLKAERIRSEYEATDLNDPEHVQRREHLRQKMQEEFASKDIATAELLINNIESQITSESFKHDFAMELLMTSAAFANPGSTPEYNRRMDQAELNLQYSFGKLRCALLQDNQGATPVEVARRLNELKTQQPDIIARATSISNDYNLNLAQVDQNLREIDDLNQLLQDAKNIILEEAKRRDFSGINKLSDLTLSNLKDLANDRSRTLSPNSNQALDEALKLYEQIALKEAKIDRLQNEQLALKHNLNTLFQGDQRIANGYLAIATDKQYETNSAIARDGFTAGRDYRETIEAVGHQTELLMARSPQEMPIWNAYARGVTSVADVAAANASLIIQTTDTIIPPIKSYNEVKNEAFAEDTEDRQLVAEIRASQFETIDDISAELGIEAKDFRKSARNLSKASEKEFSAPNAIAEIRQAKTSVASKLRADRLAESKRGELDSMSETAISQAAKVVSERAPIAETILAPPTSGAGVARNVPKEIPQQRARVISQDRNLQTQAASFQQSRDQFQSDRKADNKLDTLFREFRETIKDQKQFIQETKTTLSDDLGLDPDTQDADEALKGQTVAAKPLGEQELPEQTSPSPFDPSSDSLIAG